MFWSRFYCGEGLITEISTPSSVATRLSRMRSLRGDPVHPLAISQCPTGQPTGVIFNGARIAAGIGGTLGVPAVTTAGATRAITATTTATATIIATSVDRASQSTLISSALARTVLRHVNAPTPRVVVRHTYRSPCSRKSRRSENPRTGRQTPDPLLIVTVESTL